MQGLNWVTLPFKCLLYDGEPLSVIRTKEKARPPSCLCDYWWGGEVGSDCVSYEATPHFSKPFGGSGVVLEKGLP